MTALSLPLNNAPPTATKQGHIVSWSVKAPTNVTTLRGALQQAGFNPSLADDLTPETRVARVAAIIASDHKTNTSYTHITRAVAPRHKQITREERGWNPTTGSTLSYQKALGVRWDAAAGKVVADNGDTSTAELDAAVRIADHDAEMDRTGPDVSAIVHRIVMAEGRDLIPIREQGGVYFLPRSTDSDTLVQKLSTLLATIGGRFYAFSCLLGDSVTEDTSLANAVTDFLANQLDTLKQSIVDVTGETRRDVKSRRMQEVGALRGKLGAYATLLADHAAVLNAELDATEVQLMAQLQMTDADEPRKRTVEQMRAEERAHLDAAHVESMHKNPAVAP